MAGQFAAGATGGPNFSVPTKDKGAEKFDKFGNIVKAKAEMGMTKEQMDEQKKKALVDIVKPLQVEGIDVNAMRAKVKELHQRVCKLEADKYDLERRHERQEYDLKELNERQRQINRNKALKKGIDPEASAGRFPPKVSISSKYDRQTDRRSYGDRQDMFQNPRKPKEPKVFHGSARPPSEWGRKDNEELEQVRKNLEAPKYQETVKAEGEAAKPPVPIVPVQMPELDEEEMEEMKARANKAARDAAAAAQAMQQAEELAKERAEREAAKAAAAPKPAEKAPAPAAAAAAPAEEEEGDEEEEEEEEDEEDEEEEEE